jgi:hypothetical protein
LSSNLEYRDLLAYDTVLQWMKWSILLSYGRDSK